MEPIIGPLLTLVGVIAAAYFTYRVSNRKLKTDSGQQMIDQYQEENAELRQQLAAANRRNNLQSDYIGQLRRHIADGHAPPPPPYPDGLMT